jgi:CDGSH-type Zn-finger protein
MSETETPKPPRIAIVGNGPYIVTGSVPLKVQMIKADPNGGSESCVDVADLEVGAKYALCRCGHSKEAPFCDGTHRSVGFDGTETASFDTYDASKEVLDGPQVALEDVKAFCAVGRFCDAGVNAWDGVGEADDEGKVAHLTHQVACCPSGRLRLRNKATGELIEPTFATEIIVSEDPAEGCSGPLWVRGGIVVEADNGKEYEVRNRVTLCRCGQSKNKPFCDGTHVETKFQDGRASV